MIMIMILISLKARHLPTSAQSTSSTKPQNLGGEIMMTTKMEMMMLMTMMTTMTMCDQPVQRSPKNLEVRSVTMVVGGQGDIEDD